MTHSDENMLVFDFENSYTLCKVPNDVLQTFTPYDTLFPIYRLPKHQIKKEYPPESNTSLIIAITVPTVVGVLLIALVVIIVAIFIYKYRKMKGRQMLKEFDEMELPSLGGPLIQYD